MLVKKELLLNESFKETLMVNTINSKITLAIDLDGDCEDLCFVLSKNNVKTPFYEIMFKKAYNLLTKYGMEGFDLVEYSRGMEIEINLTDENSLEVLQELFK